MQRYGDCGDGSTDSRSFARFDDINRGIIHGNSLQVQKQGQIVIPKDVLNSLQVNEGQTLNLLQIGELVLLVPKQPQVTSLAKSFISLRAVNNVSLNDLLEGLQQERQAIWQERQGSA